MNERTSLAGQDVIFGCSKAAGSTTSTSTNTAIQILRVKVGSSYTLSDMNGYRITGPSGASGLTCNSLRAVSDTVLYVNVQLRTPKTLVLFKVTLNEALLTSVDYETRIYYPALTSSTSFSLRSFIKPLGTSQLEPEILFGGSDPWTSIAVKVQSVSGNTAIAWLHTTDATKTFLDPFVFSTVTAGGSGPKTSTYTLTQISPSYSFTLGILSFPISASWDSLSAISQPAYIP